MVNRGTPIIRPAGSPLDGNRPIFDYDAARSNKERYTVGRGVDCHIVIDHKSLSRQHCCLVLQDNKISIIDLGSSNGVAVKSDGRWVRIKEAFVNSDDELMIGGYETTVSSLLLRIGKIRSEQRVRKGSKIFISYRRAEATHVAGRIFDKLAATYGSDQMFFDVEKIPVGVDFKAIIRSEIEKSAVVLAVIGREWAKPNQRTSRLFSLFRKSESVDYVASELETATEVGVPILPILFDGASFPPRNQMPKSIDSLLDLNACSVRGGSDFHKDMSIVIELINQFREPPVVAE